MTKGYRPKMPMKSVAPPLMKPRATMNFDKRQENGRRIRIQCVPRLWIILCKEQWCVQKCWPDHQYSHRHVQAIIYKRATDAFNYCKKLNALFETDAFVVHRLTMSAPVIEDKFLVWDAARKRRDRAKAKAKKEAKAERAKIRRAEARLRRKEWRRLHPKEPESEFFKIE